MSDTTTIWINAMWIVGLLLFSVLMITWWLFAWRPCWLQEMMRERRAYKLRKKEGPR
jgi:hypothetical protein